MVKELVYILTLLSGLWGCNNQTTEKSGGHDSVDASQTFSVDKPQQDILIQDKAKYDQTFIDGLADYNESIKLIDSYIVSGKDTTYFPDDLKLNQKVTFKASKNGQRFLLMVIRTNMTSIDYKFQRISQDNSIIDSKTGEAILSSMFFLASEVDEDSETGDAYGSSEYWDKSNNCWFAIRIGIGLDHNGKQRAILSHGCEDKAQKTLNLDECPTLRTK